MRGGHQGGGRGGPFGGRYGHWNGNYRKGNVGKGSHGRGNYKGRGRGGSNNNWANTTQSDSKIITLEDDEKIEYHHTSFSYPNRIYI